MSQSHAITIKTDNDKFYEMDTSDRNKLGGGGFGSVYLGEEMKKIDDHEFEPTGKKVAIKQIILKKEDNIENAMNELHALYALSLHSKGCNKRTPFVCFYGSCYNDHNKILYLVMEKIDGIKLSEIDTENPDDVYRLFEKAIDGLEIFQKNHFVHRDIKPDNIMISYDGILKYVDFGLGCNSKIIKNNVFICRRGNSGGTERYIDPLFYIYCHKNLGEYTANHLSDIYALGASFYRLYFELPSYERGDPEENYRKVIENIEKSREIDKRLKNVLINMMNPYGKRPTAEEIKNKISNFSEYKDILSSLEYESSLPAALSASDSKDEITLEMFDQNVKELMEEAREFADPDDYIDPTVYQKIYYNQVKERDMSVSPLVLQKYPYVRE